MMVHTSAAITGALVFLIPDLLGLLYLFGLLGLLDLLGSLGVLPGVLPGLMPGLSKWIFFVPIS